MAQIKAFWLFVDLLGWPSVMLGIVANIDNGKSIVLSIMAAMYLMLRMYFFYIQKQQTVREKELELWHKEQDKQERINKRIAL